MLKDSEIQTKVSNTTIVMLQLSHTRYPVQDEGGFRQSRFDSFSCLNQRHERCEVYHFTAESSALWGSVLLTRVSVVSGVQNLSAWINTNISGKTLNCAFWRLLSDGETELLKEAAEFTLLQAFKPQLDKATINMTPCWWHFHFDWEVRLGTTISTLPTTCLTTLPFLDAQEKGTFLGKMRGTQSLW